MDISASRELAFAPERPRDWTQRVGAFVLIVPLIQKLGGDASAILASAGLREADLADPDGRIPYAAFVALLANAAEATECPHFGLLAGRMWRLDVMGLVGEMMRHSGTVGSALEALTIHQHLSSEGGLAYVIRRGAYIDFGYAIYDRAAPGSSQMYDATLAAGMNVMTELCGPDWRPYEVLLSHAKPRNCRQYGTFFRVAPRFDAELSALRFPATDLARPIAGADPERRLQAEQRARGFAPPDFMQQVYRALRRLMLEQRHSGDDVAQMLAMHRRTLNRRLKSNGTTFQHVLDDVRFETARDLLAHSDIHLDDIAATLGYAAVTPFMRTFRRWSGTTPWQWRRMARNGGNGIARSGQAGTAER